METDSKEVIDLISSEVTECHPDAIILREIQLLLRKSWVVELCVCPRDGNIVADILAREAQKSQVDLLIYRLPPRIIRERFSREILFSDVVVSSVNVTK